MLLLQGDVTLWLEHIDFCKTMNQHELLGRLYGKALAIHPRQTGNYCVHGCMPTVMCARNGKIYSTRF